MPRIVLRVFTPTDAADFTLASKSVTINVTQATQAIQFHANDYSSYGMPITLSASGGASGNSVTFAALAGPGTLTGNILT